MTTTTLRIGQYITVSSDFLSELCGRIVGIDEKADRARVVVEYVADENGSFVKATTANRFGNYFPIADLITIY
jgi:hypothetical protein